MLLIHGRSGLSERVVAEARRVAERGVAVLAADCHTGRLTLQGPIRAPRPARDPGGGGGVSWSTGRVRLPRNGRTLGDVLAREDVPKRTARFLNRVLRARAEE